MLKLLRFGAAISLALLALTLIPSAAATAMRTSTLGALEGPLSFSQKMTHLLQEMTLFRANAREVARLRNEVAALSRERFQYEQMRTENQRLTSLLGLRRTLPHNEKIICARVIGRSPIVTERTILIDKGSRDGLRRGMPVLSQTALIGKVAELRANAAKVLLISDVNCRVGAMVTRTRDQGILQGSARGGCRLKYLPVETPLKNGDLVETAGFGHLFPKDIVIGKITAARKQPGQIYQIADVEPVSEIARVEEVLCLEAN
ncbi:MAG: rod shape-determining protein MreC [Candidatus Omnitrophota bacterium]